MVSLRAMPVPCNTAVTHLSETATCRGNLTSWPMVQHESSDIMDNKRQDYVAFSN